MIIARLYSRRILSLFSLILSFCLFADHSFATNPKADLSIVVDANDTASKPILSLHIDNAGPLSARNVTVTAQLPPTFKLDRSVRGCQINGDLIICRLGTVDAKKTASLRLILLPKLRIICGVRITTALTVTSSTPDPIAKNNRIDAWLNPLCLQTNASSTASQSVSSVSATSHNPARNVHLSVAAAASSKTDSAAEVLTVTNNDNDRIALLQIVSILPTGFVFDAGQSDPSCSADPKDPRRVECDTAANPQSTQTIPIGMNFIDPKNCGATFTLVAYIQLNTAQIAFEEASVTLSCAKQSQPADIGIILSGKTTIAPRDTPTFLLIVPNYGPATAKQIAARMTLPFGYALLPDTDSGCHVSSDDIICNADSILAGQTKTFLVHFQVPSSIDCKAVTITADTQSSYDPTTNNNAAKPLIVNQNCHALPAASSSANQSSH